MAAIILAITDLFDGLGLLVYVGVGVVVGGVAYLMGRLAKAGR